MKIFFEESAHSGPRHEFTLDRDEGIFSPMGGEAIESPFTGHPSANGAYFQYPNEPVRLEQCLRHRGDAKSNNTAFLQ